MILSPYLWLPTTHFYLCSHLISWNGWREESFWRRVRSTSIVLYLISTYESSDDESRLYRRGSLSKGMAKKYFHAFDQDGVGEWRRLKLKLKENPNYLFDLITPPMSPEDMDNIKRGTCVTNKLLTTMHCLTHLHLSYRSGTLWGGVSRDYDWCLSQVMWFIQRRHS
jgi:hypothetical protein